LSAVLPGEAMGLASIEPYDASVAETEKILYSYRELELLIDSLTPRGHGGLMSLSTSPTNRPGSDVEHLAIDRARLSVVRDAIDRVYRNLPTTDKQITRYGYWDNLPWVEVAQKVHMHRRSVSYRRRQIIVPKYQRGLRALGKRAMREFWKTHDELLEARQ